MKTERWYYSTLETAIADGPVRAPAAQWRAWLDGCQRRGEVSAEERAWVGIDAWLDQQAGRISREAVLAYAQEHALQLGEVVRGKSAEPERVSAVDAFARRGFTIEVFYEGEQDEEVVYRNSDGEEVEFDELPAELQVEMGSVRRAEDLEPRYADYRLRGAPQGEDYGELVLTLPASQFDSKEVRALQDALGDADRRIVAARHGSPEWDAAEAEAKAIRKQLFDLTGDPYGIPRRKSGAAGRPDEFRSNHWKEPNVLVHARFDVRSDSEGKRVLTVLEVQSDWHQKGRKHGYRNPQARFTADDFEVVEVPLDRVEEVIGHGLLLRDMRDPRHPASKIRAERGIPADAPITAYRLKGQEANGWCASPVPLSVAEIVDRANRADLGKPEYTDDVITEELRRRRASNGVPNAPFKATEDWVGLALKRLVCAAVAKDCDRIAWVTGEQAAEMFDLSYKVEAIDWTRRKDGTYDIAAFPVDGSEPISRFRLSISDVGAMIGKELAERISELRGTPVEELEWADCTGTLKGVDLKVGGEGQRGFYDELVPATARKLAKRFGAKVSSTCVPSGDRLGQPTYSVQDRGPHAALRWQVRSSDARGDAPATPFETREEAIAAAARLNTGVGIVVHSMEITPAMRVAARAGLPLFGFNGGRGPRAELRVAPKVEAEEQVERADAALIAPGM